MKSKLESRVWDFTRPVNGQYPRPWMTDLKDPEKANVFLIGKNQKNGYRVEQVGAQGRHVDALFNRNGETCRGLYDEVTGGEPSRTRKNSDDFVEQLARAGVNRVLETNVICYSTDMSADLPHPIHQPGRKRGRKIFDFLLEIIQPSILIAHGASTREELEAVLREELLPAPDVETDTISKKRIAGSGYNSTVYCIPSLAPPAFNKWSGWSAAYLTKLAADVASELKGNS